MSVKNRLLKAGVIPDMAHFVSVPQSQLELGADPQSLGQQKLQR